MKSPDEKGAGILRLDPTSLRQLYLRRVVCTAAGCCGFRVAGVLARWLADGLFDLPVSARELAARHLADACRRTFPPARREELARASFEHFAAFWIEAVFARRKLAGRGWRRHVSLTGSIDLARIARDTRGAIFVTPYLGNPAVAAYVLGQLARPVHVVVDFSVQPVLRQWQTDVYRQPNVTILTRNAAVWSAEAILAGGGKLFMIGEHSRLRPRGPQAMFLGRVRTFYPTVALLAARCSVPIVVVTCRRPAKTGRFSLDLRGECLIEPHTAAEDDPVGDLTRRYVAAMERAILQCPEQYYWARRWDAESVASASSPAEVTER